MNPVLIPTAVRELGIPSLANYALYQMGLRSGYFRRITPVLDACPLESSTPALPPVPTCADLRACPGLDETALLAEAGLLLQGQARLFGAESRPLFLAPAPPLRHWTRYGSQVNGTDIKFTWEPARFGWAFLLCRAYILTQDDAYAQCFWQHFEAFQQGNPPNLGPNWASAQEIALRLVAFTVAASALSASPASTPQRMQSLAGAVAFHAGRIPPTLSYARAQNNNHILSEAIGLMAAGAFLPDCATSAGWFESGWQVLNRFLQKQIAADGTYVQHSTNYHRLMLQAALWGMKLASMRNLRYPAETRERLAMATRWLAARMNPQTGVLPNLGHNDGAYILPLAGGDFRDYRPVVQAGARAFLDAPCLPPGAWDEFSLWLGLPLDSPPASCLPSSPALHALQSPHGQAQLRAVRFCERPAHADQLHVDIAWRNFPLALDPGTYLYNGNPPWQNGLAGTLVHNTVTVDGKDQMLRAGRFLWLKRANAELLPGSPLQDSLQAGHDGYLRLGIYHHRRLAAQPGGWLVEDRLIPVHNDRNSHHFLLHWLLPDLPWELQGETLTLAAPLGSICLTVQPSPAPARISLVRGGETLAGTFTSPLLGWYSPAYSRLEPALSFVTEINAFAPVTFSSRWVLHPAGTSAP